MRPLNHQGQIILVRLPDQRRDRLREEQPAGDAALREQRDEPERPRQFEPPVHEHRHREQFEAHHDQHRQSCCAQHGDMPTAQGIEFGRQRAVRAGTGGLKRGWRVCLHLRCDNLRNTHSTVTTPSSSRK